MIFLIKKFLIFSFFTFYFSSAFAQDSSDDLKKVEEILGNVGNLLNQLGEHTRNWESCSEKVFNDMTEKGQCGSNCFDEHGRSAQEVVVDKCGYPYRSSDDAAEFINSIIRDGLDYSLEQDLLFWPPDSDVRKVFDAVEWKNCVRGVMHAANLYASCDALSCYYGYARKNLEFFVYKCGVFPGSLYEIEAIIQKYVVGASFDSGDMALHALSDLASKPLSDSGSPVDLGVSSGECRPTGPIIRCNWKCNNGDCILTYENGCKVRVQVQPNFDSFSNSWVYPDPSC
jgi:hypothetical protein